MAALWTAFWLIGPVVVNSGDSARGGVAPGEIVVVYSAGMGPEQMAGQHLNSEGKVATLVAETRVLFDGVAAPLASTIRGRIGAVVPYEVAGKRTALLVVEYRGARSQPVAVPVVERAPAVFTADGSGAGQSAMLNETGCCNSPRNPQMRDGIAVLYGTGAGQLAAGGIDGRICSLVRGPLCSKPLLPVGVMVGGVTAEILYAGEAPDTVSGLLQVNFRVPASAPVGDRVPLVLAIGDARSRDGVTMAVRSEKRRVLLLESESAPVARALKRAGYEVETRDEGGPFDVAICDVGAGAAVRGLREKYGEFKLIAVAVALGPRSLRAADLMGAQAVLRKPLTAEEVLRRVRNLVQVRPMPYVAGSGE